MLGLLTRPLAAEVTGREGLCKVQRLEVFDEDFDAQGTCGVVCQKIVKQRLVFCHTSGLDKATSQTSI